MTISQDPAYKNTKLHEDDEHHPTKKAQIKRMLDLEIQHTFMLRPMSGNMHFEMLALCMITVLFIENIPIGY